MYLRKLRLDNAGVFQRAELTLNTPDAPAEARALPNVTLLVGGGGAGKTTALRAIALAAIAHQSRRDWSTAAASALIRRERDGVMRLRAEVLSCGDDGATRTEHRTIGIRSSARVGALPRAADAPNATPSLVVAYGAARLAVADSSDAASESARVATLFDEGAPLVALDAWLPQLRRDDRASHDAIVALLRDLAPTGTVPSCELASDALRFGPAGVPFGALSAGQRAHLGWVGDLLFHLHACTSPARSIADVRGLVLVDQIDLHLHPEAQRHVLPTIARALPRLQFVVTTHSPLVVGSVWRSNVRRVEESTSGSVFVTPSREVFGLSADQILAGAHFAVGTTRNAEIDRHLQREVAAARDGDPNAAIRALRLLALGGAAISDEPRALAAAE